MDKVTGYVTGVNGNLVAATFSGSVRKNEVGYVQVGDDRLKGEVIRVNGDTASMQIYEMTNGIQVGDKVELSGELMSVELGPGLLTQVFDGLQNPLPELAQQCGFFLQRGVYLDPIPNKDWEFTPLVKPGDHVSAGDAVGSVPEGLFTHLIMVPFGLKDEGWRVKSVREKGVYNVRDTVAVLENDNGEEKELTMVFSWPVKQPIRCYEERLRPDETLVTKLRSIDTFLPVAKGGTFCVPGPFGAGKTVLQHMEAKNADVDIVIVAACGERAGEVVEVLKEFPELVDPRTGRSLMERTIIICNTSSMPVAAREASVYTAVTMAEYYRQMGLDVLLLADSTSRWAQAMREMSGRLEEIPGEEAFPAYLESVIASFYERAGKVRLKNGKIASVTIGGTVSPPPAQLRGARDPGHPEGGGRVPRSVPRAVRRPQIPRHPPHRLLVQVPGRGGYGPGGAGPQHPQAQQRDQPDDEGHRRGGYLRRGLYRLSEGRAAGRGVSAAELLRSHRRGLRSRPSDPRVQRAV